MKLIIAGATGYVGTELIRQALSNPTVTTIVALSRRQTAVPDNLGPKADVAKFKPVVLEDFGKYPDDIKQQLAGADACVWLMAVTPTKSKAMAWDDVKRICLDYTVTGLNVLTDLPRGPGQKPLRFIYTSGSAATRDPAKKPFLLGDYSVMRGECENKVIEAQKAHPEELHIAIAKPGLITSPQRSGGYVVDKARDLMCSAISLPLIDLREMSAALLSLAVNGANGKETYVNDDLVATGKDFLAKQEPKP